MLFENCKRIRLAGSATERQGTLYVLTTPAVRKFDLEQELNPALIAADGIDIC